MKHYISNIIFTKTPIKHKFRYKDDFQIYPLNLDNAPISKNTKHFPIIIEFWYEDSVLPIIEESNSSEFYKWITKNIDQTNKLIQITNLLSIITNYRFFFYRNPETFWTFALPENENEQDNNKTKSFWAASLYYYPGIENDLKISRLTENNFNRILLSTL